MPVGQRAGGGADRRSQVVVGAATLADVVGLPPRDVDAAADPSAVAEVRPVGAVGGPGRRARPAPGAPRARGGGGGRPQPADGGLAGRRQDDAGAAPRHDPAGSSPARRRSRRLSSTRWPACWPRRRRAHGPAVPGAAPLRLAPRACSAAAPPSCVRARSRSRHHGVLFLDELTEFRRDAVEALRQPLEDGRVVVTRAARLRRVPGAVHAGRGRQPVSVRVRRRPRDATAGAGPTGSELYRQKLSGPLLDRIDLRLRVPRLTKAGAAGSARRRTVRVVRARVRAARERQRTGTPELRRRVQRAPARAGRPARRSHLAAGRRRPSSRRAVDALALTGRGFDRALKVARTVADLDGRASASRSQHLAEALSYRDGFE